MAVNSIDESDSADVNGRSPKNSRQKRFVVAAIVIGVVIFPTAIRMHTNCRQHDIASDSSSCGPLVSNTIDLGSGNSIAISYRNYYGPAMRLWGAETSPAVDVLWDISLVYRGREYIVPSVHLRDLANVNPAIPRNVSMDNQSHRIQFTLSCGDGALAYHVDFSITANDGMLTIDRKVAYENPAGILQYLRDFIAW